METQILQESKPRYAWVDVLKFLGILSIYIGHLGTVAGHMYPFVFQFHVALFFLASGFFAPHSEKQGFLPFLNKRFCSIILPYLVFSLLNILIDILTWGCGIRDSVKLFEAMFMGVRSKTVAAALWFLPCLFIVSVLYYILKRFLKWNSLVLAVCIALYVITEIGIPYRPVGEPKLFWGLDSALCYILYYALGAMLFPYLKEISFAVMRLWQKVLFLLIAAFCLGVAALVYFKGASYPLLALPFQLPVPVKLFYSAFLASVFLFLNCVLAKMLAGVSTFAKIGQGTLILCGTEGILKEVLKALLSVAGLELQIKTQFAAFIYACALLWISGLILAPWIRKNIPLLAGAYRLPSLNKQ